MTIWAALTIPRATTTLNDHPILWVVPVLNVLAVLNIPRAIHKGIEAYSFVSSSCMIAAFVFLFITALYPFLIPASNDISNSVTLFNASSSPLTLRIMLFIALLGLPAVIAYSSVIYWTFRGKVRLDDTSY
jgi:cytochrome d ubiquinol oxidase subunit II